MAQRFLQRLSRFRVLEEVFHHSLPIADWTHEQLLAYIHYRNLPMPPIYGWKDGFKCGTHPWPARQFTDSIKNGFRDVYEIDPEIVKQAAEFIPAARHFLEEVMA